MLCILTIQVAEVNSILRLHFLPCKARLYPWEFPIVFPGFWHHLPWPHPQLFQLSISYQILYLVSIFSSAWNPWTSCCLETRLTVLQACVTAVLLQFSLAACSVDVWGGHLSFIWMPSLWTCTPIIRSSPLCQSWWEAQPPFYHRSLRPPLPFLSFPEPGARAVT